jgi:hypothetical protein
VGHRGFKQGPQSGRSKQETVNLKRKIEPQMDADERRSSKICIDDQCHPQGEAGILQKFLKINVHLRSFDEELWISQFVHVRYAPIAVHFSF